MRLSSQLSFPDNRLEPLFLCDLRHTFITLPIIISFHDLNLLIIVKYSFVKEKTINALNTNDIDNVHDDLQLDDLELNENYSIRQRFHDNSVQSCREEISILNGDYPPPSIPF